MKIEVVDWSNLSKMVEWTNLNMWFSATPRLLAAIGEHGESMSVNTCLQYFIFKQDAQRTALECD